MSAKRFFITLAIGCCVAALDLLALKFDLEPGYETYGGFGASCVLLDMPVMGARYMIWVLIAKYFSAHPLGLIRWFGDRELALLWPMDIILVFLVVEVFRRIFWLGRRVGSKIKSVAQHS